MSWIGCMLAAKREKARALDAIGAALHWLARREAPELEGVDRVMYDAPMLTEGGAMRLPLTLMKNTPAGGVMWIDTSVTLGAVKRAALADRDGTALRAAFRLVVRKPAMKLRSEYQRRVATGGEF